MILQALASYYEALVKKGLVGQPGWSEVRVSWALEIDEDGTPKAVYPLRQATPDGKRTLPRLMRMPAPVKRSSGVTANFMCDGASYMLGEDAKGKVLRAEKRFNAMQNLHQEILKDAVGDAARAVLRFFEKWPAADKSAVLGFMQHKEEILAGGNITLMFDGKYAVEDSEIKSAWQTHYDSGDDADENLQVCLATGTRAVPQATHPFIKGVRDTKPSGAALMTFNSPSFCSYGKEKNYNAPVGKYGAFAYTSALNYLISDRAHVKYIGDTAVVYWAKDAEPLYQDIYAAALDRTDDVITDAELDGIMSAMSRGQPYDYAGTPVDPNNEFYILGIAPNAARLSVRFFYRSSFGEAASHIRKHYDDIRIISDHRNKWADIPLWALLSETVNQKVTDKKPIPQMAGDLMKSIIDGSRYPETLMNQVMLRIRAERDITRGRAAIIKGYLIRNTALLPSGKYFKEVSTVSLNTESRYEPYVLGRLFAVLEGVQRSANPGINATIRDRFFNSACSTPSTVFPLLLRLSNSHLKKLSTAGEIYWSKQICDLCDRVDGRFPGFLSLPDQGAFILGYYHQTQKLFEKKSDKTKEA